MPEADLLEKALDILGDNPNGFFLVAESDDMDSAAHEHDGVNVIKTPARPSTRWSRSSRSSARRIPTCC